METVWDAAAAAQRVRINPGDTAWVLGAAALVMFMTPGLALFYGGMVRAKNVLGMLMQNFFCLGLISVVWAALTYSLAFSGDNKWIGNLDLAWLRDAATTSPTGFQLSIPPLVFLAFQLMFAIITPALITGAIADRMRFSAWVWFIGLWAILVYAPVAHWVFSPAGWLFKRGALDFAGGTVVHINAGIAALAAVFLLGKRRGWPGHPMPPHALPFTLIGAGILWFGWFGFNAGSALKGDGIAAQALVNTHMAAAAAMLSWLAVERLRTGHATTLGAASGLVAGLVAITPCAGFVGGMAPIYIGLIAGGVCALAVSLKFKFGYDDSLDVVGVHLVGGLVGSLLLGFFADATINPAGADGVFLGGGFGLFGEQVLAVVATMVWSFAVTFGIVFVLSKVLPGGIRVSEDDEDTGLDLSQHSETGYALERV
ncbi:MAG TPA: ammonium transporter [Acidimicrobiia bacterium]|nr:ammonium transporter [Acidimicrobiia bacterium]